MRHPIKPTWIVVMDSSVAYFYTLHHGENGERRIDEAAPSMESNLHRRSSDVKSDKPGRGMRAAGASARHAMEPPHDYHKLEKHDFVHAVAGYLNDARNANKFERLVLVAPDRSLGELRQELVDPLRKCVWREIDKDLVKLNVQDLWARLAPALQEELTPGA